MKYPIFALLIILSCCFTACSQEVSKKPPELRVLASHPHDAKAYTQGLVFEDGFLYESTGQYGQSTLRKVDPKTGQVLMSVSIPNRYFAEGIEIVGDKIYQLTWQEGFCFVYDKATFKLSEQFRYAGEGWGLAYDGENLILSDGSATLRFFDPKTFKQKRKLAVYDKNTKTKKSSPVKNINELEMVRGELWANIWQSTYIARIDPKSGEVLGWVNGTGFVPAEYKDELLGSAQKSNVLNGIAFDPATNRVFLTGKNWPTLFELQIVEETTTPESKP